MLVSLEWIKDYTQVKVSTKEFCDRMILSGSNIETCENLAEDIYGVKVGKIVKIERHPNADKLVVCQLDLGQSETVQIVTGADNVFEGAYVPVATDGSKIPGPLHGQPKTDGLITITKGELRGVESDGMLCGASELGLDEKVAPFISKDGIWILEGEYTPGDDLVEALGMKDSVIDFEITPNRPDCLSMIGMAREAAATFGTELHYPETKCEKTVGDASEYISVEVKSDLCKRYTARIIKDVKIEQSPWWLQKRLIHAGMRPINNIVDITNFVMQEYGQPLHAFDIRSLEGNKIVVDTAEPGEKFTTLDETERTLDGSMLMIKDAKKSVALAGVMGGLNSEIEADTNTVVLESACFNGDSVRATSKKLALRTEASARYEKGIDPNLCEEAADRFCYLVELLGAGTVVGGSVDIYKNVEIAKPVNVRVSRVNHVLGIEASRDFMVKAFEGLEMKVEGSGDNMIVTPPTIRQDLLEEVDFIEEVARMYGYDKMPVTLPKGNDEATEPRSRSLRNLARDTMCAMGANEIQTYSFVSPKGVDNVRIAEDSWERNFVKIINPLGEENSVMRTILTPNMMEVLGRNYSRNIESVKAFEIGNTFMKNLIDPNELPDEQYAMCIGMYGGDADFYLLKGMVTTLLSKLGVDTLDFEAESEYGVYHPGRCARIKTIKDGEEIEVGIMGEVHPEVADKYGIGTRVYCCELLFDLIVELSDTEIVFTPLPKYPATSRDIALVVDEEVSVGEIEKTIKEAATEILKKVELFDVYRGVQVGPGKKSAAFSITYRADDRTLTDDDVKAVHDNVLVALKEKLNAKLREM
ncbi:MAG TPA: phenylalanine--tRNA ligase subunit beta [Anaerovoracaceae bacterium]|nr:phenylalanine--tRNA ligase subunit beta [Anaerovoracaceae bacterium]